LLERLGDFRWRRRIAEGCREGRLGAPRHAVDIDTDRPGIIAWRKGLFVGEAIEAAEIGSTGNGSGHHILVAVDRHDIAGHTGNAFPGEKRIDRYRLPAIRARNRWGHSLRVDLECYGSRRTPNPAAVGGDRRRVERGRQRVLTR